MLRSTGPITTLALALILVGCSDAQRVGKHEFLVDDANLVPKSSYPFFLPRSEDDGFIFILNPDAARTEQRSVLVEERDKICDRAKGAKAFVNSTICARQKVEWLGRRWVRSGDDTFWTYSPETPSSSPAPFISCFKMEIRGHPGLCHATVAAGDLVLTIGLNDDEVPALENTYRQTVSALKRWER